MGFRQLRDLAIEKRLLAESLVWKSGSDERVEARSILGLVPGAKAKVKQKIEVEPSEVSDRDPYAAPKARTIADGPPGGLYLPHLRSTNFLLFLFALLFSGGLVYTGLAFADDELKPILFSLAGFGLIFWVSQLLVYLFRAWEMMKMLNGTIDGAKAVRFCLVPLFNALWCFVALYGWAKLWNRMVKHHPGLSLAKRVFVPFYFLFPIFFLLSQALVLMYFVLKEWPTDLSNQNHLITLGVWGVTLFLILVCWFQMGVSINFLARKKS